MPGGVMPQQAIPQLRDGADRYRAAQGLSWVRHDLE